MDINLNLKTILKSFSLSALSFFLVAGVLYAATTIGSNIATGGNITAAPGYGFDASAAGVLNIGTTTATTINIGGSQALTKILGNASTTIVSLSGNLWVGGNATTTASNGNFATQGSVGVASSSPYVALGVTGTTTSSAGMVIGSGGSAITQLLFGTCSVNLPSMTASTTAVANCTATGVNTADKVFVTPNSVPNEIVFTGASSTAASTIQVSAYNIGSPTGTIDPAAATWSWMAVR